MAKAKRKKIAPKDNEANQVNANKGTVGTNKQYDNNQGNRGKQLLQFGVRRQPESQFIIKEKQNA